MSRYITALMLIIVLAAPAVRAVGPRMFFETNFETEQELSNWDPQWVPGVKLGTLRVADGELVAGEITTSRGNAVAMTRPVAIDGEKPLMIELSVRTATEIKLVLFSEWGSEWSGYMFHFDSDSYIYHPRVRIVRMDRNRITMLGSYDTDPSGLFRFDRDGDGNWTLYRGNFPVPEALFQPDARYKKFSRIGIMYGARRRGAAVSGDRIDWLRIGRP